MPLEPPLHEDGPAPLLRAYDGLRRNAAGETLQIEVLERSPAVDRVVLPFIENLRAAGVDAAYNRVDPAPQRNNPPVLAAP